MRQGRPLSDDELAVIHHLTHVRKPAWTRARVAETLDCARGTVSTLVNRDAERCAVAHRDAEELGRIDRLLVDFGIDDGEPDLPCLHIPRSIDDDDAFGAALELVVETGWPGEMALVAVGVPSVDAARWAKRASGPAASPEDAARWHLIEQARMQALLALWRAMRAGKPGWQAIRAQIHDTFGDVLAGDSADKVPDPLANVPRQQLVQVVYGDGDP